MKSAHNRFLCKAAVLGVLLPAFCLPVDAKPKKPVLGFYTSWAAPQVRYDKITHLMYAFLLPSGNGSISGAVPGDLISTAHAAGVKVIASIGGANHSEAFIPLAASASGRTTFANACKAIVDAGSDGVDIDWEYPSNAADSANFTLLLKAVRAAIGPNKLISLDLAPNDEKGRWVSQSAVNIADFYNVMAYDFTGSFPGSVVGQHSSYQQSVIGINYWWKNRGVPKEKVVMGVPFYGKNFSNGGNPAEYKDIMAANPGVSPDADQVGQTWYNGFTTMKKKATFVAENSYGGIMVWQLGGDTSPGPKNLLDAIELGLAAPPVAISAPAASGRGLEASDNASLAWLGSQGAGLASRGLSVRSIDGRMIGSRGAANASTAAPSASGIYLIETGLRK
jgi:chitinase